MIQKLIFTVCGCLGLVVARAQIEWPQITQEARPWTRWWWEGSAVTKKDLTWNLEQYEKAGLGGTEITPIYGVYGQEKSFVSFLSPQWMEMFIHTLEESKRLGLGVDLANGTGWPFGGPWVTDADASKTIYHQVYEVKAGQELNTPIVYKVEGFVSTANNKPVDVHSLKQPVSANNNLQALALEQVKYPDILPVKTLMAYSDNGKIIDLTDKVDDRGNLNWTAPSGIESWTLYALFEGLHGKMVERAAPGGEGYAIDHFSKLAAQHYFKRFDDAFKGYDISYLRAFFNDSYEVDDARGNANWTPGFFDEFKKRKGYDLRTQLPALFGKDTEEKNSRVVYDYRSVIDALLLEHFTMEWKRWGNGKNKMLRNQSHGSPANTLDLYSVVDIPETEGNDILRFKFASSAANVTGKKLVSSESATWLNEHFLSSLGDVKKNIDLLFLGGVNHVFYHGTAYSPRDAAWPGWLFYAAVHFQPSNPQWKDFHALNKYIARTQSFLQEGTPDNDILVYYPIIDRYSTPGNSLLQHFDGMERNFEHTDFEHLSKEMELKGYSFDFFSDRQLQHFQCKDNKIATGGHQYRAILLPANKLIAEQSFEKLITLVKEGGRLLVYKALPGDVPGLSALEERRSALATLISPLQFSKEGSLQKAVVGKGVIYISDKPEELMKVINARAEKPGNEAVHILRRKTTDGHSYFINNRGEHPVQAWIGLCDAAESAALFDPMNGEKGLAKLRKHKSGSIEVLVQLAPNASLILKTFNSRKTAPLFPYKQMAGPEIVLQGPWKINFLAGGPVLPGAGIMDTLRSWTEMDGDAVKKFSGTAKYTVEFDKPSGAKQLLLNLGTVHATAEVFLNGKTIGSLIGPSFTATIASADLKQKNRLEIVVANLMANRISYMDRNNIPWKIFYNINMAARKKENLKNGVFDAAAWEPLPSGLLGPVTLTPLQ